MAAYGYFAAISFVNNTVFGWIGHVEDTVQSVSQSREAARAFRTRLLRLSTEAYVMWWVRRRESGKASLIVPIAEDNENGDGCGIGWRRIRRLHPCDIAAKGRTSDFAPRRDPRSSRSAKQVTPRVRNVPCLFRSFRDANSRLLFPFDRPISLIRFLDC